MEYSRAHALLLTRVLSLYGGSIHFAIEHQHTLVFFFHITTSRDILWHATKCEALVDMAVFRVHVFLVPLVARDLCLTSSLFLLVWLCELGE